MKFGEARRVLAERDRLLERKAAIQEARNTDLAEVEKYEAEERACLAEVEKADRSIVTVNAEIDDIRLSLERATSDRQTYLEFRQRMVEAAETARRGAAEKRRSRESEVAEIDDKVAKMVDRVAAAQARMDRVEERKKKREEQPAAGTVTVVHTSLGGKPTKLLATPNFKIVRRRNKFSR